MLTYSKQGQRMIVYDKYSLNSSREIDPNGFLRVSMSNITKSQVRPYLGREIPDHEKFNLDPNKIYNVLCSEEELKKAAKTFNNLPLTRDHIEIDVDDVPKEKIVGSLGDHATVDGKYLKNNLIIYDKKDIDLVLSGKKKELSCGYRYTPVRESGEFDGEHYDFKMTDIIGNHVALVKQGRAGRDVMVADSSKGLLESIKEKILAVFDSGLIIDSKEKDDEEEVVEDKDDTKKQEKVGVVMKEFKEGELKSGSGEKVTDPKQAIAIALSEADKVAKDETLEKDNKEKEMKEEDVDELVQDAWSEETEYNGQTGHYLTTKNGHHIFIPNGTTTKEAISKHFDDLRRQKSKELGENPWRDKEGYQTAKSSLERIKSGQHTIIGTAAAADLDKMIKELEGKIAITEEKKKEYDSKISQLYDECSRALKEVEAESEEGKPESKIKEETEYEDVEFETPRQREKVEKSDGFESKWENPELVDIGVPDTDNVSYDIMDSVMGQMSDGMWENSRAVEKYWRNANITKKDGTIGIKVNTASSWANPSPYSGMSDEEIRGYFAKKIKAVVKQELEDNQSGEWSRDNETELQYLSRSNRKPVRVKDAYKLYDHLLGRNKK